MNVEANKALVRRMIETVYNAGNYAAADEFYAPDYTSHNGLTEEVIGPAGVKQSAHDQRRAFPDLHTTLLDVIGEGDRVVVRAKDTMTHLGEYLGYPPTGRTLTISWIAIFRVEAGKLKESWYELDFGNFRRLLLGEP